MSINTTVAAMLDRYGYRMTRKDDLPVGDLGGFCSAIRARGFEPRHVFDVGANKGEWSQQVRAVFPDATFTLIEPQAEMGPFLDSFCAQTKSARWINAGAGAAPGELMLTVCPDTVSTTFTMTAEEAENSGFTQRAVPIITLDHISDELGAIPDLVKLDVEGFEYDVLTGSKSLMGTTELFLLELTFFGLRRNAKSVHEMFAAMADFGYHAYDFTWFQARPYDGALGQCEVAFAREGGRLRAHLDWH